MRDSLEYSLAIAINSVIANNLSRVIVSGKVGTTVSFTSYCYVSCYIRMFHNFKKILPELPK